MTLIFGNLAQEFVNFGLVVNDAKTGGPGAAEQVAAAAAEFRHNAALDAGYIAYIGTSSPPSHRKSESYALDQVSESSSAPLHICTFGSIQAKSTQKGCEKGISRQCCDRTSHSLTKLVLVK